MFFHAPASLVKAILNRVANAGKALKVGRVKAEEVGVLGCFDDKGVLQVDHRPTFDFCHPWTLASSSTNFSCRSPWSSPKCFSTFCVMFIEQNLGPHMEQYLASL